ncbi:hypothetical protein Sros01_73660 [Streptomyces roseochromogenus]|nr:hypothetical protein Sros01_73660 [Streptomyces roseochromogenus]
MLRSLLPLVRDDVPESNNPERNARRFMRRLPLARYHANAHAIGHLEWMNPLSPHSEVPRQMIGYRPLSKEYVTKYHRSLGTRGNEWIIHVVYFWEFQREPYVDPCIPVSLKENRGDIPCP